MPPLLYQTMADSKILQVAFLISFTGHCLFLTPFALGQLFRHKEKRPEKIIVRIKIEKLALLPNIDIMGKEKKVKESKQKENSKPKQISAQQPVSVQQILQEPNPENIKVINSEKHTMLRYQDMVKQRIEQARRYPLWAKKHGTEGVVYIYFTVSSAGLARDIRLVKSSGSSMLDEEALATIERANPFPVLPKEINNPSVGMKLAIVFSLNSGGRMQVEKNQSLKTKP